MSNSDRFPLRWSCGDEMMTMMNGMLLILLSFHKTLLSLWNWFINNSFSNSSIQSFMFEFLRCLCSSKWTLIKLLNLKVFLNNNKMASPFLLLSIAFDNNNKQQQQLQTILLFWLCDRNISYNNNWDDKQHY